MPVACPPPVWTAGDPADSALQMQNLQSANPHLRRRAAEALGRAKVTASVPAILTALAEPNMDRFLFHSLTYALLQIQDPGATRAGLVSANATVQAAALFALEQMPGGDLVVTEVIARLGSDDVRLREAAAFVVARHPAWAAELTPWFARRLKVEPAGDEILRNVLRGFLGDPVIRNWVGGELANPASRDFLLPIMADSRAKELPAEWISPLSGLLADGEGIEPVLAVLTTSPPPATAGFDTALGRIGNDEKLPAASRLRALGQRSIPLLSAPEFAFAVTQLNSGTAAAAPLLSKASLTDQQLLELAPLVGLAGVLDRPSLLKAFAGNKSHEVGSALLTSISLVQVLSNLPRESVTEAFAAFSEEIRGKLDAARQSGTPPDQAAHLDELEKSLPAGDAQRGSVVFQSAKASCSVCHPVGYTGGHFGPDLGRIGAVRTRRDLIEAIVYPSASFVRSYETVQITRNDDSAAVGIVTNQSADTLTLTSAAGSLPATIPRSEIKAVTPVPISLMPQGYGQILTPAELADIISYLQSSR